MEGKLRLLMFNLVVDKEDPILGFTTNWINELAPYCEYIDVITMQKGRVEVPENVRVYSVGRERGYSEARRFVYFYWILLRLLFSRKYDACFAHMMPLFAGMGGFLLKLWRVPITLWYVHRQISNQLKLGLLMSDTVVTAVPSSFPIESSKVQVIGHGIDTDFFVPVEAEPKAIPPLLTLIGRLTPIKNQHTLLRSVQNLDVQVALIGDVPDGYDDEYKQELQSLAQELGIVQKIQFTGSLPPDEVRVLLQQATINISLTDVGSFDKAVLEGMSCGIPTITCNPAFDDMVDEFDGLLTCASSQDQVDLERAIRGVLALSTNERDEIGMKLRQKVIEQHSMKRLIQQLVNIMNNGAKS